MLVSFAFGYLLGGSDANTCRTLAMGTAQRNSAAALLVAGTNFDDPAVVSVIVVTRLSLFVMIRLVAKQAFAEGAKVEPLEISLISPLENNRMLRQAIGTSRSECSQLENVSMELQCLKFVLLSLNPTLLNVGWFGKLMPRFLLLMKL